jgi:hypothetical protein
MKYMHALLSFTKFRAVREPDWFAFGMPKRESVWTTAKHVAAVKKVVEMSVHLGARLDALEASDSPRLWHLDGDVTQDATFIASFIAHTRSGLDIAASSIRRLEEVSADPTRYQALPERGEGVRAAEIQLIAVESQVESVEATMAFCAAVGLEPRSAT